MVIVLFIFLLRFLPFLIHHLQRSEILLYVLHYLKDWFDIFWTGDSCSIQESIKTRFWLGHVLSEAVR